MPSSARAYSIVMQENFENGAGSWQDWGNFSITRDANSGSYAAIMHADGGVGANYEISVQPGQQYTLSAYTKVSGSPNYTAIGVLYNDANGVEIGQDVYSSYALNYELTSHIFTIPSNVSTMRVWAFVVGGGTLYVDDISLALNAMPINEYYVNSQSGNDGNTGSRDNPWRTLARVNKNSFVSGEKILLAGGQVFSGTLRLSSDDSGSSAQPLVVGSYGSGRATIDAGTGKAIEVANASNIHIENLIVKGDGRKSGNVENGLAINDSSYIRVDNVEAYGFQHSGIFAVNSNHITIKNVYSHDNGFSGINVRGTKKWTRGQRDGDIYIGHCKAINNPGDPTVTNNHSGSGIVTGNVDRVTIEYCIAEGNGWDMPNNTNGPVGIWIWGSDNSLIQHNISRYNMTSPGAKDGGGFDFDGGVTNSVMQYNLSYENYGTGFGLFQFDGADDWFNNVIRYNISENDGKVNGAGISVWSANANSSFTGATVHNNVIYSENGPAVNIINNNHSNFRFINNIFVHVGDAIRGEHASSRIKFTGNLWHRLDGNFTANGISGFDNWAYSSGQELLNGKLVGIDADPEFLEIGPSQLSDPLRINTYSKYIPSISSPAAVEGLNLSDWFGLNDVVDIQGNDPTSGDYYTSIGAYQSLIPKNSSSPDNSETPDNPDLSDNPETPDNSETPDNPESPDNSETPDEGTETPTNDTVECTYRKKRRCERSTKKKRRRALETTD